MDGLQLLAEYKEAYRPPSLRELYWEIYNLQVNPDLKGEVSARVGEFGANLSLARCADARGQAAFQGSLFP